MILVGQYDSPFVRRVAITLHHYGMAFERNPISVFGDAEKMAGINPVVRIPSLVLDDGAVLIDSGAIIDYLDDCAGEECALAPRHGRGRREILQLVAYATGAIDKAGAIVYERWLHPAAAANAGWIERCRRQLNGALSVLETRADDDWLWDGRLTHADVATGVMLGYLDLRLPEEFPAGTYPRLTAYWRRLEELEIFLEARPAPDE
ncbi:MAG: glutathione S-transferase family protein, partial [Pseudomonadota bacterium]|nr:glutathione S-transferase family protein [Pseudomonadota bacterium]